MFGRSKYVNKLIMLSLIISIVPILLLGYLSYQKSIEASHEKIFAANKQGLVQQQLRIEQTLTIIEYVAEQFAHSSAMLNLLEQDIRYADFERFNDSYAEIKKLLAMDLPVKEAYLVNFRYDWLIHQDGLKRMSEPDRERFRQLAGNDHWFIDDPSGAAPSLFFIRKLPNPYASDYSVLLIELASEKLNPPAFAEGDFSSLLVMDSNKQIIGGGIIEQDLAAEAVSWLPRLKEDDNFTAEWGGKSFLVSAQHSDYNDWTYLSLVPVNQINEASRFILKATLVSGLAILFITLSLAFILSLRIYLPVRRLCKTALQGYGGYNRKTDEFELISNRIHSLVQQEVSLSDENQRIKLHLKDVFLLNLLEARLTAPEYEEGMAIYELPSDWKQAAIIVIELRQSSSSDCEHLQQIHQWIKARVDSDRLIHAIALQHAEILILSCTKPHDPHWEASLPAVCAQLQTGLHRELGIDTVWGAGSTASSWHELQVSYEHSLAALQYRIRDDSAPVLSLQEILPHNKASGQFPEQLAELLDTAISQADETQARLLLHEMLDSIWQQQLDYREYRILLIRLWMGLWTKRQKLRRFDNCLRHEINLIEDLSTLRTPDQVNAWFWEQWVSPLIQQTKQKSGMYNSISEKMINMIEAQFDRDLTLEACAAEMNYHPNYLKRVFKQETGTTFSEYLMNHRLAMSQQWLLDTNMSISQIAERLRYSNIQNFTRYFKNKMGMTPSQFRLHHNGFHND